MLKLTLGCMYAGKTSALINEVQSHTNYIILDYGVNTPNTTQFMISHNDEKINCLKTWNLSYSDVELFETIFINEAQFFKGLISFIKECLHKHKNVYVYGLDGDFKQESFGEIIQLIPLCDEYVKLYARCTCGNSASFSKRLSEKTEQYLPNDIYKPSCRRCLQLPSELTPS
jgi:thymidine kinase